MRKYLLVTFLISFVLLTKSQLSLENNSNNIHEKIFPVTPETYSLFKAGVFPVDYRTGKLNISIPIYTIQTKSGVSIPINLVYNTGGIKVDETSSAVGLGWSLSIPNNIVVEQHGLSDLKGTRWFPINPYDYEYDEVNLLAVPEGNKLLNIGDGILDTQPDIFHYNLPTVSGSFIRDSDNNFHPIPSANIKIDYKDPLRNNEYRFQIIDEYGNKYLFDGGNWMQESNQSGSNEVSQNSFYLKKIILTNNEVITFSYQNNMFYKSEFDYFEDLYQTTETLLGGGECAGYNPSNTSQTNFRTNHEALLTEINYEDIKVQFNYSNNISGFIGRKDLDTNGSTNSYALKNIIIKNKNNHIVKDFQLLHNYFVAGQSSSHKSFRLKLNGITETLKNENYRFEYEEAQLPKLNSLAQDLWGYYNGNDDNTSLIPNLRYVSNDINYSKNKDYTTIGADRAVNFFLAQAFQLKKINYPTGGFSEFEFENNTIWKRLIIPLVSESNYGTLSNAYNNQQSTYQQVTVITPSNNYFYFNDLINDVTVNEEVWVEFINSCSNKNNTVSSFPENGESYGVAYLEEFKNGTWYKLATFDLGNVHGLLEGGNFYNNPSAPKRIKILRTGNCFTSLRVYKKSFLKENNQNNVVGGLRIKKIKDFDGQNNYTREFKYNNPDLSEQSSGYFVTPLKFADKYYGVKSGNGVENDYLCQSFKLSADQTINSSISGNEFYAYEYVTEEKTDKGKTVFKFINNKFSGNFDVTVVGNNTYHNPYELYNNNIIEKIEFDNSGNWIQRTNNSFIFDYSKNELSPNSLYQTIAFSTRYRIHRLLKYCMGGYGCVYHTTKVESFYPIRSGKYLLDLVTDTKHLAVDSITQVTKNDYILNTSLPINLKTTKNIFSDSSITETTYSYSHEKNNLYLMDKNMVGIPLETTVVKKKDTLDAGKIISKVLTQYPTSESEAVLKTSGLPLPYGILSKSLQTADMITEVTYDRYDPSGNLLQYTSRSGIPTAIIWGYGGTRPVAKIEGATYDNIKTNPLILAVMLAEDTDYAQGTITSEQSLITALDNLRKGPGFSNYQITTYTYDPLIGVRSITPPSGIREVYIYDSANRLKEIRQGSHIGNILKEFKYNYKP